MAPDLQDARLTLAPDCFEGGRFDTCSRRVGSARLRGLTVSAQAEVNELLKKLQKSAKLTA